ncbi:MAG: hypothetical protein RL386_484 [Bacteroidota bacterium]|jgi:hypothetical protein
MERRVFGIRCCAWGKWLLWAAPCLLPLLSSGCLDRKEYSQSDIDALIEKEVRQRVEIFIRTKEERCMEDILKAANQLADSIMVAEAFFDRDTFSRPEKPARPDKPHIKVLQDTTPVEPLIKSGKQ